MSNRSAKRARRAAEAGIPAGCELEAESATPRGSGSSGAEAANRALISPTEHLRPYQFKPGESGNPSGRPKGVFRETALRHLLKHAKNGETALDSLISAQVEKAIRKRDTRSAEFLRDTVDGRPAMSDSDADRNKGVTINIVWGGPMPEWAESRSTALVSATLKSGDSQDES